MQVLLVRVVRNLVVAGLVLSSSPSSLALYFYRWVRSPPGGVLFYSFSDSPGSCSGGRQHGTQRAARAGRPGSRPSIWRPGSPRLLRVGPSSRVEKVPPASFRDDRKRGACLSVQILILSRLRRKRRCQGIPLHKVYAAVTPPDREHVRIKVLLRHGHGHGRGHVHGHGRVMLLTCYLSPSIVFSYCSLGSHGSTPTAC